MSQVLPSSTLLNMVSSKMPSLDGQLQGQVVKSTPEALSVQVQGKVIDLPANTQLVAGQKVMLRMPQTPAAAMTAMPASPATTAQVATQLAMTKMDQNNLASLVQLLQTFMQNPEKIQDLPPALRQQVLQWMNERSALPKDGESLKGQLLNSGVFFENKIRQGQNTQGDTKQLLLSLLQQSQQTELKTTVSSNLSQIQKLQEQVLNTPEMLINTQLVQLLSQDAHAIDFWVEQEPSDSGQKVYSAWIRGPGEDMPSYSIKITLLAEDIQIDVWNPQQDLIPALQSAQPLLEQSLAQQGLNLSQIYYWTTPAPAKVVRPSRGLVDVLG